MAVHLFGAIDLGSYEIELKVFELSRKRGIRQVDDVRHRIDLGSDTYATGKISRDHVAELERILLEFKQILNNYGVEAYRAYGTSAFREMKNASVVISLLEQKTGLKIDVLGNSSQRFLDYKSVAFKGSAFNQIIENPSAIVDIGGGSVQISLFDQEHLVATQNLKLGVLRLHEQLAWINAAAHKRERIIEELVESQLEVFSNLYLNDRQIRNVIVVDDYLSEAAQQVDIPARFSVPGGQKQYREGNEFIDAVSFERFVESLAKYNRQEIARDYDIADDNVPLLQISAILIRCVVRAMHAEMVWAPGVTLCDGIVYEFAEKKKYIQMTTHNFDEDIIACARQISRRYQGSRERAKTIEEIAMKIFDATKKIHGMGDRERLLLQIATILHDCGKYISMVNLAQCSYDIITSTEIIGLSHEEREIVAYVVYYNHEKFNYYEQEDLNTDLSREDYIRIGKLTAILRVANGLDRSHRQKFRDLRVRVRDEQLQIVVYTDQDISLEKGLFGRRADFFEEVYGIRPVIRRKK